MQTKLMRQTIPSLLIGGAGLYLLLASWAGLYVVLLAWTKGALAPWDTIHTHEPPLGTLPRTLNDFFEWRGLHVPSVLVVVGGLGATAFRFVRTGGRVVVLWQALLANILFLPALFPAYWLGLALDNLGAWVTGVTLLQPRFSFGYLAAVCGLWLGYLTLQSFGVSFLRRKFYGKDKS